MAFVPGSPEWQQHAAQLMAEELENPLQWWYLSFAEPDKFNGACLVRAHGILSAVNAAHRLRINPGGEVLAVGGVTPGPLPVNRLLSKADMQAYGWPGRSLRELDAKGIEPGLWPHFTKEGD